MLNKRNLIILTVAALVLTALSIVAALLAKRYNAFQSSSSKSLEERLALAKDRALQYTQQDELGKPMISTDQTQSYLLIQDEQYQIVYQKTYDTFLISINASPFETVRKRAEEKFVGIIGGDKETACQLSVRIVTPAFANPDLAGIQFPLGFCTP